MAKKFKAKDYPTMNNKDKEEHKEKNENFYLDRIIEVADKLDLKVSAVTGKSRSIDNEDNYQVGQKIFGVTDKLDDIDDYIKEIKKSEKYEKFMKKHKKSK